ncbi:MAG: hypothetical protein M1833_002271 [Piccolia ochrophora]|nr:MAG: hypothetical protein M1833_002271 [Piccolia ochrophora]
MSLLQNQEFTLYHLRTSYLNTIKDGVGERLITVDPAIFNTPALRSAGWHPNSADVKRTYSPPIPTAIASEYFQAPPRSAGLPPAGFAEDDDEGGMVTGGAGSGDTVGPAPTARRRRRREPMEEDDSSDLSDESDDDGEGTSRPVHQIRFAKMPVRTRSGSSPIRSSTARDGPSLMVTSPSRRSGDSRLRRGSLGAVEAIKARARRDTTTSSDMSSENELDPMVFQRKEVNPANAAMASRALAEQLRSEKRQNTKDSTDLEDEMDEEEEEEEEDSADDSEGTVLSSEFAETADSPSILGGVSNALTSSPLSHVTHPVTPMNNSPRKSKAAPSVLQALPPPRPISMVQPVSALSQAINAKRSKAASPFERFATLSGKGDPNPLQLKIYAPFSSQPTKPYEVPLRRIVREDGTVERKVTVVDAIGLSLWRYSEEDISPAVAGEKMDVNRWTLRMVEDEEVDYDFPALDRTKPMSDFTSNNNRAARSRSNSKVYDEFALVEATGQQYKENDRLTPNPPSEEPPTQDTSEVTTPQPMPNHHPAPLPRRNPVLGPSFNPHSALRSNINTPADVPSAPASHATPRTGSSKLIKIHLTSPEGYAQFVALHVTTDTYMAEVLDTVCKRRNLDKATHLLKVSGTNVVAPLDRTVESLGEQRSELDLVRRRFGLDAGPMSTMSPGSTPPNAPLPLTEHLSNPSSSSTSSRHHHFAKPARRANPHQAMLPHPLAQKQDLLGLSTPYKRYTVWRKQPMSFLPTHERSLAIDGEFVHIMPAASSGTAANATGGGGGGHAAPTLLGHHNKAGNNNNNNNTTTTSTTTTTIFDAAGGGGAGKTTTVHVSAIVGCKVSRKHASHFSFVVFFKSQESKRYDFEAQSKEEAAEIVEEIKRGMEAWPNADM